MEMIKIDRSFTIDMTASPDRLAFVSAIASQSHSMKRKVEAEESMANAPALSAQLRTGTISLHREIELVLGLPGAIRCQNDYVLWLGRYLGIYEPLEHLLAEFPDWDALDRARPPNHTARLLDDLIAIGADPSALPRVEPAQLPALPTFAFALGASYVLEGATLGGRLILRDLQTRIGAPIANATRFFGGKSNTIGSGWPSFKSALDGFGDTHPKLQGNVVAGAERTFSAMLAWFAAFRVVGFRRS